MAVNDGNGTAKGLVIDAKMIHLPLTDSVKSFIRLHFGPIIIARKL
jgi:hypothetical protein